MQDDHRIFSKPTLQFTIECGTGTRRGVASGHGGKRNLEIIGRMMAGEAARYYKWSLPAYRPVYVIITVNLRITTTTNKEELEWRKNIMDNRMIPIRSPAIHSLVEMVSKMLVGPVINNPIQICAITTVKKLSKDRDYIEVFVGAPTDWTELNHDIRNG